MNKSNFDQSKILVCYLFTKFDNKETLLNFVQNYKKYDSGLNHDLLICFKLMDNNQVKEYIFNPNDYGYELWVQKAIEFYSKSGDVVVLISSSGNSMNIVNAAMYSKENKLPTITFSGFDGENKLKQIGDINLWVNSKAYNIVENTHQIWLLMVCDLLVGKAEYSA